MSNFSFQITTLIQNKAINSKNFKELLDFAASLGFHSVTTPSCAEKTLLHIGKRETGLLEVTDLLIALHLFATQRHEDLTLVGKMDEHKFSHRLFGTLSIEKLHNWSNHLHDVMRKTQIVA
ncbi:MAG: hypothetical protein OEZ43_09620 [Gammaproteobacteria bacterium]|nr:hypothetical protein [Gammaproteobacteria bacterium]